MSPSPFDEVSGRAEYAARFNRVVDHIQAHLAEPLDLETLAEVACFSPFHFHRLFHAWMGETIHDFIQRLRLERAAAHLLYSQGKSITEIALDCGFSSSATFARAFRAHHGRSASDWRKERNNRKTDRKICKAEAPGGTASSGMATTLDLPTRTSTMTLTVTVKHLAPMHVAYIRHVGSFQGDAALFERLFTRIRQWAQPRGLLLLSTAKILSIHHDNPEMGITDARRLRLDAAVTIPADTLVQGEIGKQRLDGGTYAVTRVRILGNQYMATWDALMSEWLPGSGFQLGHSSGADLATGFLFGVQALV